MTKLTKYNKNPIEAIDRLFDDFFNITPIFHNLEDVYNTGDQVRFSSGDKELSVQIDLPGVKRKDVDINVDEDSRQVFIKGKRRVISKNSEQEQTLNRSFTVGGEYLLTDINFTYQDGVLDVKIPRKKKEEKIKKYTV